MTKRKMFCLGSVSINYATITEEQRKQLKRATEGLATLKIESIKFKELKKLAINHLFFFLYALVNMEETENEYKDMRVYGTGHNIPDVITQYNFLE